MEAKIIKTEAEYEAALAYLETLMEAVPGSPQFDDLELFALLVEKYEDEHYPIDLPDPIEAIKFRMEQQNLSPKDLIPYIGSQSKVSEVLNYKRPLSLSMIRALSLGLGIPAAVLLQEPANSLQTSALASLQPPTETVYTSCLQQFFDSHPDELQAWQAKALKIALKHELPPFERSNLDRAFFRELVGLSSYSTGPRMAGELLNKKGIHLVALRVSFETDLDGATFFTPNQNPLIGLTLRHDRLDDFWLALFHQLAHLALYRGEQPAIFYDSLDCSLDTDAPRQEQEVNQFLKKVLIAPDIWKTQILTCLEAQNPRAFRLLVQSLDLSPEIVACRLRLDNQEAVYEQLFTPRKVSEKLEVYG